MLRGLFQRLGWRSSRQDYYKSIERYRREHPESLEEDREQIQKWIAFVDARRNGGQERARESRSNAEDLRLAHALYELREVARAAFMSHPAASETDFRRCWPSIREELLKQHALEELAGNPNLSRSLAIQISEASLAAGQESHWTNLQLLK